MKKGICFFIFLCSLHFAFGQGNSTCQTSDPFCTGTTYNYPAGVNTGTGQTGPNYGCLGTQPNPAWFYMQIAASGPIIIYMYSTPQHDLDFACWGPFTSAYGPCTAELTAACTSCPNNTSNPTFYPSGNLVDCSYSTSWNETVHINNAISGEWYILLITNYSNNACNIIFDQQNATQPGAGSTNCGCNCPIVYNNGPLCCGQTLELSATESAYPGATYTWTGPNGFTSNQQNPMIPNACTQNTGTYSMVITANGQTSPVWTTEANIYDSPNISLTDTAICAGETVTFTPTSAANYFWSTGDTINSLVVTPQATTSYSVTGTDIHGCVDSANVNVLVLETPSSSFATEVFCNTAIPSDVNTATLTYDGTSQQGATYLWQISGNPQPSSVFTSAGPQQVWWNNVTGLNYYDVTLTVTNPSGCASTTTQQVQIYPCCGMEVPFAGNDDNSCGLFYQLQAEHHPQNTGYWAAASGNPGSVVFSSPGSFSSVVNVSAYGTYKFIWSETYSLESSCSFSDTIQIVFSEAVQAAFNFTPVSCFGASTTVSFNGSAPAGSVVNWDFGNAQVLSGSGQGPFTLIWNAPGVNAVSLTVSKNFCTSTILHTINTPPPLSFTSQISHVECNGACTGEINFTPAGGTPPYTFLNAQNTSYIVGLCAGYYTLKIIDSHGCFVSGEATVIESPPLVSNIIKTEPDCNGQSTGSLFVEVTGGVPDYNYFWSDNSYDSFRENLHAGMYYLTIQDYYHCSHYDSIEITEPPLLNINISATNSHCHSDNGLASLNVDGGIPPYFYSWSNANLPDTNTVENLASGIYFVTVTDYNNCASVEHFVISDIEGPEVFLTGTDVSSCFGYSTGTASADVVGGIPPYSYIWSNGASSFNSISNISAGNYSVVVTDSAGCTGSGTIIISEPAEINISYLKQDVTCFGLNTGSLSISASGGTNPITFNFFNNTYTLPANLTGLYTGPINLTITDSNQCTKTLNVYITEPSPVSSINSPTAATCFGGNNGSITSFTYGGTYPYSFLWSNGLQTENIYGLSAGNYSLTVTDANGCPFFNNVYVAQNSQLIISGATTNASGAVNTDGAINLTVSGGTTPYSYLWSTSDASESLYNIAVGEYLVTVTDAFGCQTENSFIVDFTNDIRNLQNAGDVKIYPNPNDGIFYLVCPQNSLIEIYDISGKLIVRKINAETIVPIDIKNNSSGLYFISIRNNNDIQNIKFIKY
ncbi:MAG: hypothetical protein A2275_03450 [Bacteroidetes bacterium RIFOXYA12_FULL_35_11]|nr:MAG: hypothetical protein A2X01_17110 [Bacteroidetes bacterium GWF2_35_48]OFY82041.1 MAG: hypothetical protein A2275_03450 [Bacteroidetes bacterium RIFOXYA12_FULL_35_11]HBX51821.1 hypothetical protein [Bacteroidales bacterium]